MSTLSDGTLTRSEERILTNPVAGIPMLLLTLLLLGLFIALPSWGLQRTVTETGGGALTSSNLPGWVVAVGMIACLLGVILIPCGLMLVNPNQSRVVTLFGRYQGSVRKPGLWWVNPFTIGRRVSLRIHNFNSEKLKVNDLRGNPIEIGAVVVWRVNNTAQAAFDVEDYESYVEVQSESAIRTTAAKHPYDAAEEGQTSLRGDSANVNLELLQELGDRLDLAGVEVLEVRISHLAYAPEIAGAMLRRQQAEAIIDARARIVEGAVGMVKMAIDGLAEHEVVHLDEERKAAMVSNLLVVLCSESETTPVVNTGSLYT
jgi:regulator of protease activity HflC (stomatin/prohibitin superfamily)